MKRPAKAGRGGRGAKARPAGSAARVTPIANQLGQIRRSQLVGIHGPGAIVDLRAPLSGAPISGLVAGLEEWDGAAGGQKGVLHPQAINEPRLQAELGVAGFRQPPVRARGAKDTFDVLPVVRFPDHLQCPRCHLVKRSGDWAQDVGRVERRCAQCSAAGEPVFAVPVRFIVACERGHLDEFPWRHWCGCDCARPQIQLDMTGPGLAGKIVSCRTPGCHAQGRSLEGVFNREALDQRGFHCRGLRPWLAVDGGEQCDELPRVLQRGASNVYWGECVSSLDIPPFSSDLTSTFGRYWDDFADKEPETWPDMIRVLKMDVKTGLPAEVLLKRLQQWREALNGAGKAPLEWPEYQQFSVAGSQPVGDGTQFDARPVPVPAEVSPWLESVVAARRLREVRAMVGFTRIHPPAGPFRDIRTRLAPLSIQALPWLPAIELRGEGIFLRLDSKRLLAWEALPSVQARCMALEHRVKADLHPEEPMPPCSPRFLLLHSLAHALVRQLSLDCGYSSSALRERLYSGLSPRAMSGILIHTGSPDSEGTLGGLVRQSEPSLLGPMIRAALGSMAWCSSDPLCISGVATLSSPRNASACHACLLVPETCCQHFNVLLDRALLVGIPEDASLGFFSGFLA